MPPIIAFFYFFAYFFTFKKHFLWIHDTFTVQSIICRFLKLLVKILPNVLFFLLFWSHYCRQKNQNKWGRNCYKKIEVNYFLLTLWKLSLFQSNGCLKIYFNSIETKLKQFIETMHQSIKVKIDHFISATKSELISR